MNLPMVDQIARAILYEGYALYPYRASAVKNQQRFNFGVVYPQAWSEASHGVDACRMQVECLVAGGADAKFDARVRFLQLVNRQIGRLSTRKRDWSDDAPPEYNVVPALEVGGQLHQTWQEVVEHEVVVADLRLDDVLEQPKQQSFVFPAERSIGPLRDPDGDVAGVVIRQQEELAGGLEIHVEAAAERLFKVRLAIVNETPLADATVANRDVALAHSLLSAHAVFLTAQARFISLLDPPEEFRAAAAACRNIGAWPVLVGEPGECDTLLASPIILYDYPQIAPESAGDMFDGTEIDEILALRIMTLTDEEKREMRGLDDRTRAILQRTEMMPQEQFMKLHGAVRGLRPAERRPT